MNSDESWTQFMETQLHRENVDIEDELENVDFDVDEFLEEIMTSSRPRNIDGGSRVIDGSGGNEVTLYENVEEGGILEKE